LICLFWSSIHPFIVVNPSLNGRCKPQPARPVADVKALKAVALKKKQQKRLAARVVVLAGETWTKQSATRPGQAAA
jgi:hypothetical protein